MTAPQKLTTIGLNCFKYSLIIGTALFILYVIKHNEALAIIGFFYLLLALVVNSIILLMLLASALLETLDRARKFQTIGLMLVNIPIATFYLWLLTELPLLF